MLRWLHIPERKENGIQHGRPDHASASYKGAEELITACPLCMYNLRNNGTKEGLPVTYFTELLAEALGIKEEVQA